MLLKIVEKNIIRGSYQIKYVDSYHYRVGVYLVSDDFIENTVTGEKERLATAHLFYELKARCRLGITYIYSRDKVEEMSLDELLELKESIKSKEELQKMPLSKALMYLVKNHWSYDMDYKRPRNSEKNLYYVADFFVISKECQKFEDEYCGVVYYHRYKIENLHTGEVLIFDDRNKDYRLQAANNLLRDLEYRWYERDWFKEALPYEAIIKNKKRLFPKPLLNLLYFTRKEESENRAKNRIEKEAAEENKKKEIAKNTAVKQVYFNKYMAHMVR
ncbi:MAG: hypothetical protein IKP35_00235 [Alphaproteobacteria bacterium]|nr:hypothetical protein [Alphaproteobacteria bacterium]